MGTTLEQRGEVCILQVEGDLVVQTVGSFSRLVEQCRQRDARDFIVDLEHARGVDSAGLEALTALQRECEENLGMVKLCGLSPTIAKILEMTRLDRRLDCRADRAEALGAIGHGG